MAAPFFTVEQCQAILTKLYDASVALAAGKSVSVSGSAGGRSITRMSADEINSQIELWEKRLEEAKSGKKRGARIRLVNPI